MGIVGAKPISGRWDAHNEPLDRLAVGKKARKATVSGLSRRKSGRIGGRVNNGVEQTGDPYRRAGGRDWRTPRGDEMLRSSALQHIQRVGERDSEGARVLAGAKEQFQVEVWSTITSQGVKCDMGAR